MKWIAIVLGTLVAIVAVAVVILLVLDFRKGAGTMDNSVVIDRPPAAVWPWITRADLQTKWVSWLAEIRPQTTSTEGVGSRALWVMHDKNNGDRRMEITGEITAVVPGQSVALKLWSDGSFDGTASYTLVDLGNGKTRLDSTGRYHYQQAFARLLEPLITPQASKKMDFDLQSLKSKIESQPK